MSKIRTVASIITGCWLQLTSAFACSAPPERFDPKVDPYVASVVGVVANDVGTSGNVQADLVVRRVLRGRYLPKTLRINWHYFDPKRYPGACAPNGPNLTKGNAVIVYLISDGPGWLKGREVAPGSGLYARQWKIMK